MISVSSHGVGEVDWVIVAVAEEIAIAGQRKVFDLSRATHSIGGL